MTSTPPHGSRRIHTPPTPLHGAAYDTYEPYSPRRSKRSTAQSNPYSSFNGERSPRASTLSRTTPPPTTVKKARFARAPTQLSSPPSSPASVVSFASPVEGSKRVHKTPRKTQRSTAGAQSDSDGAASNSLLAPRSQIDPMTMLPTPSKTPTNKKRGPNAAIASASRVLHFQPLHPNDVMPSPRSIKKAKQQRRQLQNHNATMGFELYEDDVGGAGDGGIEIFTDANARVPVLDESEDNPFVGRRKTGAAARPQRRGRKTSEEMRREQEMRDAVARDEGMVYVFRGKKVLKRFSSQDPEDTVDRDASPDISGTTEQRRLRRQAGAAAQRPLTRSAIKPRLLFPSEEQRIERERRANEVDEEAVTDIEMPNVSSSKAPRAVVGDGTEEEIITPIEDSFTSATTGATTPPGTARASKKRKARISKTSHDFEILEVAEAEEQEDNDDDEILASADVGTDSPNRKRKTRTPFDSWQRTKVGIGSSASGVGKKRAGEAVEEGAGGGKRTRGGG